MTTCYDEAQCWAHAVKIYHSVMFAIAIICLYFIISTWHRIRKWLHDGKEATSLDHIRHRRLEPDEFTI
jgi:hypothetical protein